MWTDITHSFQSQTADSSSGFVFLSWGCGQILDKKSFALDEGVTHANQG